MTRTGRATRANSAASQGAQVSRSVTEGLFSGGAHRTAATILAPISRWPSPAAVDVGSAASPHRCSEANRTSPLRSPVKIRPVRLPPCAAGASPRISTPGLVVAPAGHRAGPSTARCARTRRLTRGHLLPPVTSRGQARQTDCRAVSSARLPAARPASVADLGRVARRPGWRGVAGSPGQPLPGGAGGRSTGPAGLRHRPRDQGPGEAVEDVVLAHQHLSEAEPRHDPRQDQRPAADHVHPAGVHHGRARPARARVWRQQRWRPACRPPRR